MMEMEEAQWETSDVSFYCPECKMDVDGTVDLPIVYDNGDRTHLPVNVQCFSGRHKFDGWVKTNWDSCEIELDEYPEIIIKAAPMRGYASEIDDYDHDYYEWSI
ncbi:hypothetical protein [uncultured Sulfitobacter sp.]|uniref:hypothetical protein n=1 Tax=uncultured Sulfitobacter sp. TaxID=191468 RepID=UPI0026072589|nr:hypothetical protein [uncultured Sulfitobacter sp.]